jgi:hypothetical protein
MAKTDLTIRFPNKTSRTHFMNWLKRAHSYQGYDECMDGHELDDTKTKKLTILSMELDYVNGVVHTNVGRLTDLRAVNLS